MNKKPNIIVFFTDQQRWDTTGVHGNPLGLTPNFDRVAARGTHLFNSYTCQPVCLPARCSFQTGKYAEAAGCFNNSQHLSPDDKTIAHHLNDAGYHTGYIGKWHLAPDDPVTEEYRGGYQTWLGANLAEFLSGPYDAQLFNNDNEAVKLPGYRPDAYTDAAIRFVDEHKEEPFFLFLSFLEPHHQNSCDAYCAPDGYREQYAGRWTPPDLATLGGTSAHHLGGYYGCVKRIDECFGRMLDALKSLGLDDDTIVIFTSDHGCHFKTRNDEYKRSCHDASIRVPTAITGPGFERGGQVREMVSLIDLPPTILDAAGVDVPSEMHGRSLLPLVNRQTTDWPEEVFVQISESCVGRAIRTERWKYSVVAPDAHPFTDGGADVYVEDALYDTHADPYEQNNLIGLESLREVQDDLQTRLIRRMEAADEKAPEIKPAEPWADAQLYNNYEAVRELLRQLRTGELNEIYSNRTKKNNLFKKES